MHVMSMLAMIILLSFSVGCVQQPPVENTTNITVTPTEITTEPTVIHTVAETTAVPTKSTTAKPKLSENDRLYLKNMENRLDEMYEELERRETEINYTLQEIKVGLDLSQETLNFIDTAHEKGYDYSHVVEKIKTDVTSPKKRPDGRVEYWELTEYGKSVLTKLESYEEGISQQKEDIIIQKRRINEFYKAKGLPASYNMEVI